MDSNSETFQQSQPNQLSLNSFSPSKNKRVSFIDDSGYESMFYKSQNNSYSENENLQSYKRDPYATQTTNNILNQNSAKRSIIESEVNLASSNLISYSEDYCIKQSIEQCINCLQSKYDNGYPKYSVTERRHNICNLLIIVRKTPLNFEIKHINEIVEIIKNESDTYVLGFLAQLFYIISFSIEGCEKLLETSVVSILRDHLFINSDEAIFYLVGAIYNTLIQCSLAKDSYNNKNIHRDLIPVLTHSNVKVVSITIDIITKLMANVPRVKHELFENNIHLKIQRFMWRENDPHLISRCCQLVKLLCTTKQLREKFIEISLIDSLSSLIRSPCFEVIKHSLECINILIIDLCIGLDKNSSYILQINQLIFLLLRRCFKAPQIALIKLSLEIIVRIAQNNEQAKFNILRLQGIQHLLSLIPTFSNNDIIGDVFLCLKLIFKEQSDNIELKKSMFKDFSSCKGIQIIDKLLQSSTINQSTLYRVINFLVDLLYINNEFGPICPVPDLTLYKVLDIYKHLSFKSLKPLAGVCDEAAKVCCLSTHISILQCILLIVINSIKHFSSSFDYEQIISNLIYDTSSKSNFVRGLAIWILDAMSNYPKKWSLINIDLYLEKFNYETKSEYKKEIDSTLKKLTKLKMDDNLSSCSKTTLSPTQSITPTSR